MTDRYRVPKRKVRVEIQIPRLGTERAYVFLGDRAATHGGEERPSDLFNGDEFLPVEDETGRVVFVRCDRISTVTVSAEEELGKQDGDAEELSAELETQARLAITLDDGSVLSGTTRYEMPEARRRVQDFLNTGLRFVPLQVSDKVVLVNKHHIAHVAEI